MKLTNSVTLASQRQGLKQRENLHSINLDNDIIQKFDIYRKKKFKTPFGEHAVLCDLLNERKRRLDNEFDFSEENMEKLRKIDGLLRESSKAIAKKTEKIFNEAKQRVEADGFTHDFEIESFIRPNVDALWEEDQTTILDVIDEVWENNNLYSGIGRSAFYDSCNAVEYLNELEMDDGRCITNTPLDNLKFCWAFHNLIEHSLYALVDILHIPEFWNEVQIRYQNFVENQ